LHRQGVSILAYRVDDSNPPVPLRVQSFSRSGIGANSLDSPPRCDHTGHMRSLDQNHTASVVQLKARLSEYLRRVKAGTDLVITERGLPIARLVPLDADARRASRDKRLIRAGLLRPGRPGGVRKQLLTGPKGKMTGVLEALVANREEDDR